MNYHEFVAQKRLTAPSYFEQAAKNMKTAGKQISIDDLFAEKSA